MRDGIFAGTRFSVGSSRTSAAIAPRFRRSLRGTRRGVGRIAHDVGAIRVWRKGEQRDRSEEGQAIDLERDGLFFDAVIGEDECVKRKITKRNRRRRPRGLRLKNAGSPRPPRDVTLKKRCELFRGRGQFPAVILNVAPIHCHRRIDEPTRYYSAGPACRQAC